MGGMIAQAFAIEHPDKTLSLCSIMSTTGDPAVGQPEPEALEVLTGPPPQTVEEAADARCSRPRSSAASVIPSTRNALGRGPSKRWNRDHDSSGSRASWSRSWPRATHRRAARRTAPTLVIHGADDPLVTPSGGEATAKAVPGAELLNLEGMGHDLPIPLWPQIIDAIVENAGRASTPT